MPKKQTIDHDGEFWFEARYAAKLLGTIPRKIDQLVGAGTLDSVEIKGNLYVREQQITALRRDPRALKTLLATQVNHRLAAGPGEKPSSFKEDLDQSTLPWNRFQNPRQ